MGRCDEQDLEERDEQDDVRQAPERDAAIVDDMPLREEISPGDRECDPVDRACREEDQSEVAALHLRAHPIVGRGPEAQLAHSLADVEAPFEHHVMHCARQEMQSEADREGEPQADAGGEGDDPEPFDEEDGEREDEGAHDRGLLACAECHDEVLPKLGRRAMARPPTEF